MPTATALARRRCRVPLLLAAALAGVLGLAGCSSDSAGEGGSTDGATSGTGAGQVEPEAFLVRVLGAFEEYESARVEVSTSGVSGGVTATGKVDYSGEQPAVEMVLGEEGEGGSLRVRTVGDQVYVSVPPVTGQKYVSLGSGAVPGLDKLTGGGLDPRATFRQLSGAVTRVEDRGSEERDGQTLRHYRMHVDTSRLSDEGGASQGPAGTTSEELVYDLYLDGEDRLVRSSVDLGHQGGRTVVELSGWGEDLSVTKPSQDELADQKLGQLLQGLRQKQGDPGEGTPAPSPSG